MNYIKHLLSGRLEGEPTAVQGIDPHATEVYSA
jgi:hypothetical protein